MKQAMRFTAGIAQFAVVMTLLSTAQFAAADLHDEMDGRWFVTEVIVFERERVGLLHGGEPLLSDSDWSWPLNMHLIRRVSKDGAVLDPAAHRERDTLKLRASDEAIAEPAIPLTTEKAAPSWRSHLKDFEEQLAEQGPVWLDSAALTMTSHRRDIERRLGASILFHGAWRQDVPGRETPYPIMLGDSNGSLFGTLSVTVNRFLHVSAGLNFPVTGNAVIVDSTGQEETALDDGFGVEASSAEFAKPLTQRVSGVMRLSESRRVRSEELHYLDHPRFGVLLRIQEISFPESLETAWKERAR